MAASHKAFQHFIPSLPFSKSNTVNTVTSCPKVKFATDIHICFLYLMSYYFSLMTGEIFPF